MKKKMLRGFISVRIESCRTERTWWYTKEATADDDDVAEKCVCVCSRLDLLQLQCGVVALYTFETTCNSMQFVGKLRLRVEVFFFSVQTKWIKIHVLQRLYCCVLIQDEDP